MDTLPFCCPKCGARYKSWPDMYRCAERDRRGSAPPHSDRSADAARMAELERHEREGERLLRQALGAKA